MMQDQPPRKPKLTSAEQRQRREDRLICIRLRILIGQKLDARGITDPAAIGEALGMRHRKRSSCCTTGSGARVTWLRSRSRWHGWDYP